MPRNPKIREHQLSLRSELWPKIQPDMIWDRHQRVGFITIPRAIPLIMVAMDTLSKNRPVSSTYLELWCRSYDEGFVTLSNKEHDLAFAAGFTGERAVHTWRARIDILAELGFIALAPGPAGVRSYALILNPYLVLEILRKQHRINDMIWNTLRGRMGEIKATDLNDPKSASTEKDTSPHRLR
jgi:hypothetical protein